MKWSRWLTWLGAAISVAGVIVGIWLQVAVRSYPFQGAAVERLDYAAVGIGMTGSGALLAIAAQIMAMMQATQAAQALPAVGIVVAELSEP